MWARTRRCKRERRPPVRAGRFWPMQNERLEYEIKEGGTLTVRQMTGDKEKVEVVFEGEDGSSFRLFNYGEKQLMVLIAQLSKSLLRIQEDREAEEMRKW